jgi:phosphoesterase RecJ-like protein
MSIDFRPFVDLIHKHHRFVLHTHLRADCDALGSELALAAALAQLGKSVRIVNGDTPPPHIRFLDTDKQIEVLGQGVVPQDIDDQHIDCRILLDTSAWQQMGPAADIWRASGATKIVIDHHVSGDDLGAHVFKDTTSESNGRLVMQAIEALGIELTPSVATQLFTAMATDTGWFRFSSVTRDTLLAAAKLVAAGARPASIFSQLFERNTLARVKLHGRIVASMQVSPCGQLAWSCASADDFAATGALQSDTEDVVNRLLTVEGVEAAALFVEVEPNLTKASLRSRTNFDVRQIAERFGGGGHTAAAGVRIESPIAEAAKSVIDAMQMAMR